jgi:DNA-binding NtrC family response regulator
VLESELFGHEKAAFTGAIRQRLGRFEQADRGTLFLDEIGAGDLRVQLRLLRVLQEQCEFERVGGTETLRGDVRVIAATNVDLQEEVRRGNFREDLFYRLNVIQLKVPPLRQRKGDIPLLVEYFSRKLDAGKGGRIRTVDAAALDHLSAYPWPGNVQQLENAVERMVVLAGGAVLNWRADDAELVVDWEGFREARCSFERYFLCSALHRYHGVISQVAEAVGLSRKSLYDKLEYLEIDYERYRLRS